MNPDSTQGAVKNGSSQTETELDAYRIQDLLSQAPAGIGLLSGPEHRWIYVNDHYVRIARRKSSSDFVGKTLRESLPEIEPIFSELLDEAFRSGEPFVGREMKVTLQRTQDGPMEEAYFDFVYQPVRDSSGHTQGILVHAVEVSDRVTSRKAIEETAQRLRLAQATAHIGTWEWDPVQNSQALSPELHEIFGTDAADPNYVDQWSSRIFKADRARVWQCLENVQAGGQMDFEYRYEHPVHGLRWLYCTGSRLAGRTTMIGIVQDVTDRKNAEDAVRKSEERLRALVTATSDVVYVMSADWSEMRHLDGRNFLADTTEPDRDWIEKYVPPSDQSLVTRAIEEALRTHSIFELEHRVLRVDGSLGWTFSRAVPILDEAGNIVEWFGSASDITARKQSEEALRKADKLAGAGRMAATIAHEINNPLEAVINLSYLASKEMTSLMGQQYLATLEAELNRIAHITKQTLQFYKENRKISVIDIAEAVDSILRPFVAVASARGAEIRADYRTTAKIQAFEAELRQVFTNFITNSLEASATRILIRVSDCSRFHSGHSRGGVRITFCDNGSGIPPHVVKKLFEPFFTTKDEKGTGLGLWVIKGIIQKHDGRLRMRSSTRPGRSGTSFCIFLPAWNSGSPPRHS